MIADVENGIYIVGNGSFSIDQQRYNFQFGGQLFYEIKDGKIVGMLRDVAYQSNTQEFWNSCARSATSATTAWAAPSSTARASPARSARSRTACATARFNGVNVINTARKIVIGAGASP